MIEIDPDEKLLAEIFGVRGMEIDPAFENVLEEIGDLHAKKSRDYGTTTDPYANIRATAGWGIKPWLGALVRAGDKVARLQQFARSGTLANESAEDSLLDLATYAVIALVLLREERNEP